jgi:hypothetical protein
MARVGYFDGSSWAYAELFTAKTSVVHPRPRPIAAYLQEFFMGVQFSRALPEIQSRVT